MLTGENRARLAREVLPSFLPLQRWFGAKGERIAQRRHRARSGARQGLQPVARRGRDRRSGAQLYFLPLRALWGEEHIRFGAPTLGQTLAKVRRTNRLGALIDAARDPDFAEADRRRHAGRNRDREAAGLTFRADGTAGSRSSTASTRRGALGVEQSNVSIAFGDKGLLKIYRRLRPGRQPDIEVGRFLTEVTDSRTRPPSSARPPSPREGEEPATIAACFAFVPNQGDGWKAMVDALGRELEDRALAGRTTPRRRRSTRRCTPRWRAQPPEDERRSPTRST